MTLHNRFLVAIVAILCFSTFGLADTVYLKNGYEMSGTVDKEMSSDKEVILKIGTVGLVRLKRSRIDRLVEDARTSLPAPEAAPAPAVATEMIQVRLKKSPVYGNGGILYGVRTKESTDDLIVLNTPGAGITRIAKDAIDKVEPYRPIGGGTPMPAAADSRLIRTTHLLHMKNGRKLQGNLIGDDKAPTLNIEVGHLGRMLIPARSVEKVEAVAGTIELPPETRAPITSEGPVEVPGGETEEQPLEIIRIDPQLEETILTLTYELTRNRTTNRVRAENQLRRIGEAAIPYLDELIHDPFDLTRRATMRIIRDVGSWEGVPMAIDALLDEDAYVRLHAIEALRKITRRNFGYQPSASLRSRIEGRNRWQQYYYEILDGRQAP